MDPFIGQIILWACSRVPQGWLLCNGWQYDINQYQALYSLIGTTYGGNSTSFNVPNLQGLVVVGAGSSRLGTNYVLGQTGGAEKVALVQTQMPNHTHGIGAGSITGNISATLNVSSANATLTIPDTDSSIAVSGTPNGHSFNAIDSFVKGNPNTALNTGSIITSNSLAVNPYAIQSAGNGLPHENMQPFLVLNYLIAVEGIYPSFQ